MLVRLVRDRIARARAACPRSRTNRRGAGWATLHILGLTIVPVALAQPAATQPAATQPARGIPSTRPAFQVPGLGDKAVNPHWTDTGCRYCHVATGRRVNRISPEQVEDICMQCHDGRRAPAEPHPVGRRFERTTKPPAWPAPDGKITCITCHDVHLDRHYGAPRPAENPMFLRAWTGDVLAFCGRCHPGADQPESRFNPHLVQVQAGQVVQQSCDFCHAKPMPHGPQASRTGEPALRADSINLCIGCHTTHIDWFTPGHIGAKTTPEVRIALQAAAARRGVTLPEKAGLGAGFLPLGNGETVTCATCHNPHQVGVFAPGSVLAAGAIRPPGQANEQLRGLGKELCGACHAK